MRLSALCRSDTLQRWSNFNHRSEDNQRGEFCSRTTRRSYPSGAQGTTHRNRRIEKSCGSLSIRNRYLEKTLVGGRATAFPATQGNSQAAVVHDADLSASRIRFSAKGFRSMRERLELSAPEVAGLLQVSVQTVYNWEAGTSRPREPQLSAIGVLRKTGKRELAARLSAAAK